jgi:Ser/Thr protein kinase RdoA (MazF antagonist)
MIRIPKPSYLLSRLVLRQRPDAALYKVLTHLAELYQLGEIQLCHRAPRSNSLNFFVTTSRGKFIFRRHRLSEETVAHEHQVLTYLQQRGFSAPRMLSNQAGQAWVMVDGTLYSVYEFVEGYCPTDFVWWPTTRRDIINQAGHTLGEYHQAITGLVPSFYKWDGYRPAEHRRWREGELYRQALKDIYPLLQKSTAISPVDDFARSRIAAIEQMLDLESRVEECSDLSKLVIHGDYAPWNVRFRPGQSPFVLDFNAARLDLKIFDVILATFFFAWRGDRLDQDRVMAFQTGYGQTGHLHEMDFKLVGDVFQWVTARSMAERLRTHYLEQRFLIKEPTGLERFYKMCVYAKQQPQQLVAGLIRNN